MKLHPLLHTPLLLLLALVACDEEAAPEAAFCDRLELACGSEHDDRAKEFCDHVTTIEDLEYPSCTGERDAMLRCVADQELVCPDDYTLYAGAPASSGHQYDASGYAFFVSDACVAAGDAWDRCRHCPTAIDRVAGDGAVCGVERSALAACIEEAEPRCVMPSVVSLDGAVEYAEDTVMHVMDGGAGFVHFQTRETCLEELRAVQACECAQEEERTWLADEARCEDNFFLWTCHFELYFDDVCDCGCGAPDPACASASPAACEYCLGCGCDELAPDDNTRCL